MRHVYRCSCCRTRNTFNKPLTEYVRPRRCWSCGHRSFYVDRERMTRLSCQCGGYHHPHRPGSRMCEQHPLVDAHRAKRAGAPQDEVQQMLADAAFDNPARPWRGSFIPL